LRTEFHPVFPFSWAPQCCYIYFHCF
jgi:hypothetical protein